MEKKEQLSFEKAVEKLEEVVEKLENDELNLADALKYFEQGIKLTRYCKEQLSQAEGKIKLLLTQADGEVELTDFKIEESEND